MRLRPVGSWDEEPLAEAFRTVSSAVPRIDLPFGAKEHLLDDSRRAISRAARNETLEAWNGSRHRPDGRRRRRQELGVAKLLSEAWLRRGRRRLIRRRARRSRDLPAVQEPGLVEQFGPGVVSPDRTSSMWGGPGSIVKTPWRQSFFADPKARQALEAIVHPSMRARFLEAVARASSSAPEPSVRAVVLDATQFFSRRELGMISAISIVDWSIASLRAAATFGPESRLVG